MNLPEGERLKMVRDYLELIAFKFDRESAYREQFIWITSLLDDILVKDKGELEESSCWVDFHEEETCDQNKERRWDSFVRGYRLRITEDLEHFLDNNLKEYADGYQEWRSWYLNDTNDQLELTLYVPNTEESKQLIERYLRGNFLSSLPLTILFSSKIPPAIPRKYYH